VNDIHNSQKESVLCTDASVDPISGAIGIACILKSSDMEYEISTGTSFYSIDFAKPHLAEIISIVYGIKFASTVLNEGSRVAIFNDCMPSVKELNSWRKQDKFQGKVPEMEFVFDMFKELQSKFLSMRVLHVHGHRCPSKGMVYSFNAIVDSKARILMQTIRNKKSNAWRKT